MNANRTIHEPGHSLWLDNIIRGLLTSGTLQRYIDELAVSGLTSNPTIFANAIKQTEDYDEAIQAGGAAAGGGRGSSAPAPPNRRRSGATPTVGNGRREARSAPHAPSARPPWSSTGPDERARQSQYWPGGHPRPRGGGPCPLILLGGAGGASPNVG